MFLDSGEQVLGQPPSIALSFGHHKMENQLSHTLPAMYNDWHYYLESSLSSLYFDVNWYSYA